MTAQIEEATPDRAVNTGESSRLHFNLKDALGDPVDFGSGTIPLSLELSRYEETLGEVDGEVNGRTNIGILNADIGTMDVDGLVEVRFLPADSEMKTTKSCESHIVKVTFTYLDDIGLTQEGIHFWKIEVMR